MESNEMESGRFVMRSMDIRDHGAEGMGNG
jgi:hypothetical protein